jgi:subtilisin
MEKSIMDFSLIKDEREWGIPPDHRVHEDQVYPMASVPSLWHIPKDVFQPIWDSGITGKGVTISIDDTGVNPHDNLPTPIASKNFTGSRGGGDVDRHGHGTHVAGTALGRNGLGAAPEADLIAVKVLSDGGSGSTAGINNGRIWAAEQGADIISESLGGGGSSQADKDAIDRAYQAGASICVAAAGNSGYKGRNTIGYPGRYMTTCCVGAYRKDGSIATFSSGGREIDVATPGQDIISASNRGGYVSMSGTSMATPMFSGLMALVIHKRRISGFPDISGMDQWREFFQNRGFMEDAGDTGKDNRFGLGKPLIVNILKWLKEPLNI